jgi:Putative peptidoglycan binding domain
MPFQLSRAGNNVPAEVQRWQYFLRKQGIDQVGLIDAEFGLNTELATKFFQVKHGISANGKVTESTLLKAKEFGYTLLPTIIIRSVPVPDFPKNQITCLVRQTPREMRILPASSSFSGRVINVPMRRRSSRREAAMARRPIGLRPIS